jgi:hypothetical protein
MRLPSGQQWVDGSQFTARREKTAAALDAFGLLDVAGAFHFAFGRRLRGSKRRIDGR